MFLSSSTFYTKTLSIKILKSCISLCNSTKILLEKAIFAFFLPNKPSPSTKLSPVNYVWICPFPNHHSISAALLPASACCFECISRITSSLFGMHIGLHSWQTSTGFFRRNWICDESSGLFGFPLPSFTCISSSFRSQWILNDCSHTQKHATLHWSSENS